jgi:hypothetical protein
MNYTGLSFMLVSIFFLSCSKQETHDHNFLSLDKTNIRLDPLPGSSENITVQSSAAWTAVISSGTTTWLQLDKTSGGPGNTVIKLTGTSNNPTVASQTGTVVFSQVNGNTLQPVVLTVTQKPYRLAIGYSKTLGGSDYESVRAVNTPDGGIVMAGFTSSTDGDVHGSHGKEDAWIIKLNSAGDTVWTRAMGGTGDDEASAISVTSDGSYIVTGSTDSDDGDITDKRPGFNKDVWVVKLDGNGHTGWSKTFGGSESDAGYAVIVTPDGGCLVAGATNSNNGDVAGNHGGTDVWVLKLDNLGHQQWAKTYGGSSWDEARRIVATAEGYVLAGLTNSGDGDVTGYHPPLYIGADMLVINIDFSGNKIWAKAFGGTSDDNATSITAAAGGGYLVAGYTNSNDGDVTGYHGTNAFFYDMWALKLNEAGDIVWAKTFGGKYDDAATSVVATPDGGFVLAGATASNDGDVTGNHNSDQNDDLWIVGLNARGNKQWTKAMGGSGDDAAYSISVNADGYTVIGVTSAADGDVSGRYRGQYDIWVTRLIVQ